MNAAEKLSPPLPDLAPGTPVAVGLSGGVDSAVTALLAQEAGLDVRPLFMKNWEEDDAGGRCSAAADLADARAVCDRLGLPLATVNFAAEYWERVFAAFLDQCRAGFTPNPDVLCNREIKFREFLDFARTRGAEYVLTGHYARTARAGGRWHLLRGRDPDKDQSYFLHALDQDQLARARFPLGGLRKREVRALAARAGLPVHAKRDSTGICFIGPRNFRAFLARWLPAEPGPVRTPAGEVVGEHQGLAFYTLGQRQGLGIGGRHGAGPAPWYVAGKDHGANALVVVQGHDHPLLYSRWLTAGQVHWIAGRAPRLPLACTAKTRYRQQDTPCLVKTGKNGRLMVEFDSPQWAVAPGQWVVFYAGEECLGGGRIETTERLPEGPGGPLAP